MKTQPRVSGGCRARGDQLQRPVPRRLPETSGNMGSCAAAGRRIPNLHLSPSRGPAGRRSRVVAQQTYDRHRQRHLRRWQPANISARPTRRPALGRVRDPRTSRAALNDVEGPAARVANRGGHDGVSTAGTNRDPRFDALFRNDVPVSYTHLTLPTN